MLGDMANQNQGANQSAAPPLRATVTTNGTLEADPAQVLIDGSDTAVTANGIAGYVPQLGDRVLVQQVGGHLEIIQFLTRSYITGQTIRTAASGNRVEVKEAENPFIPGTFYGAVEFITDNPNVDPLQPAGIFGLSGVFSGTNSWNQLGISSGYMLNGGVDIGSYAQIVLSQTYDPAAPANAHSLVNMSADEFQFHSALGGDGVQFLGCPVIVEGGQNGKYFLIGQGAGRGIHELTFGLDVVHVSAASSDTKTIAHGLGSTPTLLLATSYGTQNWNATTLNKTSTSFDLGVRQFDNTAGTVDINVFWLAAW